MSDETLAKRAHEGNRALLIIEDRLDDLWPECFVDHITTDSYDNSLEVYFAPETPTDLRATQKEVDAIRAMGFSRVWFNFADGTEQYMLNERKKVQNPKWKIDTTETQ